MTFVKDPLNATEPREIIEYSQDLEDRVEGGIQEVTDQLADIEQRKSDKNNTYTKTDVYNKSEVDSKTWSLSNLGQDVKETMTGGSVAVVGTDAVDTTNVKDGAITSVKRTVFGNKAIINYGVNVIDFITDGTESKVVIPSGTRFRSGTKAFLTDSDVVVTTGATGYYLFWNVISNEISTVRITQSASVYNENMA